MTIEITTGSQKLLTSGSFITFDNNPVSMTINEERGEALPNIRISWEFAQDNAIEGSRISFSSNDAGIIIRMINFNNVLGQGLSEPTLFASDSCGKQYYICFIVRSLNNKAQKIVSYSIYRDL